MKRKVELFYDDGSEVYKFFEIKQNEKKEFIFLPAFNSGLNRQGNHFTYHKNGYYSTTLKDNNGFCLQRNGWKLKPISEFTGVMQVICLSKKALELDSPKIESIPNQYEQYPIITKNELEEIPEPNINILLLEPRRKDILETQKPYSLFLNGKHIIRYFDMFSPWVVLLIGSGISN
jgi:hypothetical protein